MMTRRSRVFLYGAAVALVVGCSQGGEKGQEGGEAGHDAYGTEEVAHGDAMVVSVGCGMCIYKMEGVQGCKTAAMIDGTPVLVTGVDVDPHAFGLCEAAKEAAVTGEVVEGQLVATKLDVR